jgi:hypothetical protein
VTPPQPGGPTHKFLSDALVARGFVTQRAMDAALHASRAGRRYSEILVGNGDLSDDDLARTLADHHHIDHVDLDVFPIDPAVCALVPAETADRLGALPVALLPTGEVVVAVHDPEALSNMAEIAKRIGREIRAVVASRSKIERHIVGAGAPRGHAGVQAPDAAPADAPGVAPAAAPVAAAPVPAAPVPAAPVAAAPASAPARAPAPVSPEPFRAAAPDPVEPSGGAERRIGGSDDHAHIAQERSQIAERARSLAQYRDEMAFSASPTWASAPDGEPRARGFGDVTVPADRPRQATVAGAEAPATVDRELEQRLDDAERRAREADVRATAAERRMREADARAAAAAEQADAADARTRAAEKQAAGMSAAATAANEALAQLAQARLISDQTARASVREIESLSNELDVERGERRRLESELQRRLWQERNTPDAPRQQAAAAPGQSLPAAPQPAPLPVPVAQQPVAQQPVAQQPVAPHPVLAQPAPQPVAQQPVAAQPVARQSVAAQPLAAQPPVAAQPVDARPAVAQPIDAQPAPPVGARPVAQQPAATAQPVAAQQPGADAKKVRGLRRMIAALRR